MPVESSAGGNQVVMCGHCMPMAAETECLCCQEDSDVFYQCLDAMLDEESCCITYNWRRVGELFWSLFKRNLAKLTDV